MGRSLGRGQTASHKTKRAAGIKYFSSTGVLMPVSLAMKFQWNGDLEVGFWIKGLLCGICGWSRVFVRYYMTYRLLCNFMKLLYCKDPLLRKGAEWQSSDAGGGVSQHSNASIWALSHLRSAPPHYLRASLVGQL